MKFKKVLLALLCLLPLSGCNAAKIVNSNLNQQANSFELYRQFSLINLRTDKVLMEIEGLISISNSYTDGAYSELAITIKTGANSYKKHYCYLGGEVCYLVEQKENSTTDPYHWQIRLFWTVPQILGA